MRSVIVALGLIICAAACEVEDVDDVDFRSEEGEEEQAEDADAAPPKIAVLYDNCAPLSGCSDATCSAGRCWYQREGSIWKIPDTDIDCHQTVNGDCRCHIAQKATVDARLIEAGWTLTDEGAQWAAGDQTCEVSDVPEDEPE